jgi:asparagine synthetase B (glutamine-hydrolysing)
MRWSVELRVPFLDLEYFRAAATAARPFLGKRLLVAASHDRRVREVAGKRKLGFGLPMNDWMSRGPLAASVTGLRASDAPVWCYLRAKPTLALIDRSSGWARRWSIALLNSWLESYLAQPGLEVK